ncbi:MAG TPA: hypothetical protein VIL00_13625 [Pseudonocardiaceae bacterium]
MSLKELALRVRRGEVKDGALVERSADYARVHKIYARKKDN